MKKIGIMAIEITTLLCGKRNVVIRKEIPDRYDPDCKEFREVEILLKPAMDQPNDKIGDSQANKAYHDKFRIFFCNFRILASECPCPVQYII